MVVGSLCTCDSQGLNKQTTYIIKVFLVHVCTSSTKRFDVLLSIDLSSVFVFLSLQERLFYIQI